ncbi:g631 [Coccomyxa viridis]|uniref:threonine--tRNA ligase n=1 Tax=Coccomyxa viridis TaxID=1274662 RepID=A0ABP1FMX9_9CHLO
MSVPIGRACFRLLPQFAGSRNGYRLMRGLSVHAGAPQVQPSEKGHTQKRSSALPAAASGYHYSGGDYGLLEASPGGCACCSPASDFRSNGRRLISASQASTSGRSMTTHALASAPAEPVEGPEALKAYVNRRIELFEQFKLRESEAVQRARAENVPIRIQLPDGSAKEGVRGVTTPQDILQQLPRSVAKKAVVAKVDGRVWDMFVPLEGDCNLQILTFEDPEGKETFWHSSAHVLGEALESCFGAKLTIGPALEEGFYYDCYLGERTLSEADKAALEKRIQEIVKEKQEFDRVVVSREEALSMFEENKFKAEIINGLPQDATISLYRCGPMVDLCHGPHLPNTGLLKASAVNAVNRAHWRADVNNEPLQRVYGITFPDQAAMKDYQHRMEEAKRRDHRNIGTQQELFFFDRMSPGSCFFQPNGARIYNTLVELIREKYWEYGYEEVVTPNLFNFELWERSGHAEHYKDNMFLVDIEDQEFGLKPMNCPGHCLMFGHRMRSYRELPIRLADFGVLHRNEFSGALQGLTRVRRFQQDDAHVFCRPDQVMEEVSSCLRMLDEVYQVFGLTYKAALSTRPDSYLGTLEQWDTAESALKAALDQTGKEWELNEADGAFYGPKIDITVFDALRRKFQCATIQLDFQLPIRFDLQYKSAGDAFERPVIVHRAVLGSVERMFAILTENFAGKWPLWLSPRQVMVIPISEGSVGYAQKVRGTLRAAKLHVEVDASDKKMQKKVREAQLAQFNYILVVGEKEEAEGTVNVRTRDNVVHGMHSLASVKDVLLREKASRSLTSIFGGHEDTSSAEASDQHVQNGVALTTAR